MGWKQHAWAVASYGWMVDQDQDEPLLLCADGQRPLLVLPPGLSAEDNDKAFGWALAELVEQRHGWLGLLRMTVALTEARAA